MVGKLSPINLKEKQVKDLAEQISGSKTLVIASIKGLPSKQFQEIKKTIREHASVQVAKKNIMLRSIKAVGKESILPLEEHIKADCAFVISDLEGFELAGVLAKKKTPVFAKAGQIALEDIEVKGGPTDLVPGPAISELGELGLQVAVEEGKISIKKTKVVIREGQTINENAASLFQKLNIQPFTVGLEILAVYDVESGKIYTDVKIDPEFYLEELKKAYGKSLGFAQKIVYYCKETIGYFLAKANAEGGSLSKLVPEDKVEEKIEEKKEEVKEDAQKSEISGSEESINSSGTDNAKQEEPTEQASEEKSAESESGTREGESKPEPAEDINKEAEETQEENKEEKKNGS